MTVLQIHDADGVRLLTLDRPEAKNAFNEELWHATREGLAGALDDDTIRCAVLTGSGDAFSAGQDLGEMADPPPVAVGTDRGYFSFIRFLEEFDKPLIAAVNGVGVGIGLTVLPYCDLVFMGRSARLKAPFVTLGVTTEAASSVTLAERMGWQDAAHLIFTAAWLTAEEAVRTGLAWRLCDDDALLEETLDVARVIGAMPVNSLRATKRLMLEGRRERWRAAREREDVVFPTLVGSDENMAALTQFLSG